jgi:hypothetical protein
MKSIRQYIFKHLLIENDLIKKILNFNGITIEIEWLKGETREYPNSPYKNLMHYHYGYINGTTTPEDTEEIDICLYDPKGQSNWVGELIQLDSKTGAFNEKKYMLGFPSPEVAKQCYIKTMEPSMFGGIKIIPFKIFKEKIVRQNLS